MAASDLERRAQEYAAARDHILDKQLGYGNDGTIWSTRRESAVKVFEREASYFRERDAYFRLRDHEVESLRALSVPCLVDFDDRLLIVEMDIVSPPYLLDFGKAYVDHPPDFSAEVMRDWEKEKSDLFGGDWPQVKAVLAALRRHGIYYFDATPGNIRLRAEP